jgi:UDP-N-acetylmuramate dehydrogenase
MLDKKTLADLHGQFGSRLQENVQMSNFSTMNVGGPADALLIANSADQLADYVAKLWQMDQPVMVLGGGSNLLISDKGIRGIVVINHAHNIKVNTRSKPMTVWAESGALMINVGKLLIMRGMSGMEWAATIPGTVGGAVYGNAGAFGKETCRHLIKADVLHRKSGRSDWTCDQLDYSYRASKLKRDAEDAIILSALFELESGDSQQIRADVDKYRKRRLKTQPPGASMGSTFRNPPDDKAGRLIEAAGLKGRKIGGAIISPKHANFIINEGGAKAQDVLDLLVMARQAVEEKFNIKLIPEIEVVGDWEDLPDFLRSHKSSNMEAA